MQMMWDKVSFDKLDENGEVACKIQSPNLSPGVYFISIELMAHISVHFGKKYFYRPQCLATLIVTNENAHEKIPGASQAKLARDLPPVILDHSWLINGQKIEPSVNSDWRISKRAS